ncbi:uncharacterized protein E5676_scaffold1274G00260 [Cucumis melo var. makuwa]|uniref:DUF8039 domain-containing protein n=1 Tax=Cucumis melo var. makuwa TaxID=1194695 RepID=A0A5D3D7Q9_CUCMM|nr:uncharacterized protein E5676_scaffold1274G00260 [Cucumis melo var. makuwa]
MDRTLSASSFIRPSKEQLDQAHLYVTQNVNDVLPYVEQHMESLRKLNFGKARSKKWIQEDHNRSFSRWLSTWVALALEVPKNSITPSLRWIAHGPSPDVATYSGYIIDGYYYHTKKRDDIRGVQNSGVSITATTMQVSSSKDKNPVMSDMTFYGIHRWRIVVRMKEKCFQKERRSKCVYNHHMSRKGYANLSDELKIKHDVSYRSTLWKEAWKGRNNDYFDDATRDCASRIDELVATHKNEDILTDALGSKEHGGCVRGVGGFVSQSQYFNTVKGKEKMITPQVEICHKEEDDSRCKSDKKRSNHSRSSIGSINIDLDADEDTPSNKGVEGTPCQLSIGSIKNIVAVATIVEDNIGCSNVKVLVDVVMGENLTIPNPVKGKIETLNQALGNIIEWPHRLVSTINDKQDHSTRKDVVYSLNYTDVKGIIKLLNRHVMNNMKDVDMICIPMNELIFESDKFVYLAREDLLHYCDMVEIGYMCILAYITCLWDKCDCARNFFVIDQSKISSHIKDRDLRSRNLANQLEAVNLEQKVLIPYNTGGLKTWQAKHDLQRYRLTPKWRPVKCPRQLDSVGCGYYVQKYIHEIVHNSSTSITSLFNT